MISHDSLIFITGAFGGAWAAIVGVGLWGHVYRLGDVRPTEDDSRPARPSEHEIPVVIDMRGKQSAARVLGRYVETLRERSQLRVIHVAHRKHEADQCQAGAQSRRCGSAGDGGSAVDCHGSGEIGGE